MTNLRNLAFAGLTLLASAGTAFAAPHAYQSQSDQYQSYYQGQQTGFPGFGPDRMFGAQSRTDASCYRGVYPWTIETCGVE